MSDELVFYTNPMSRGRIIRWMLEEVGCAYRTEVLDYASSMKGSAYRAINPMAKVPAITHRGQVVTECAAICAYLADAFPEARLAPSISDRADYYRWLFFMAGPFEAAVSNNAMGWVATPERERMMGYGTLALTLDTLEAALDKVEYIAADHFTAADLYTASHLAFGMQFGTVEKRPAFVRYADRMTDRPAAIRAREIDDTLIAEMKQPA